MSMIQIKEPNKMKIAHEVFGTTFGVGTRNLPPCKGYPRKILERGNIMNLVNISEGAVTLSFKELIKEQRIDFLYEELTRSLTIQVKYSDVKAEDDIIQRTLNFPFLPMENNRQNPQNRRRQRIPIDTNFVFNEVFYS